MPEGLGLHTWSKYVPIKRLEHNTNERILSVEIGSECVPGTYGIDRTWSSSASIRNFDRDGHAFEFRCGKDAYVTHSPAD